MKQLGEGLARPPNRRGMGSEVDIAPEMVKHLAVNFREGLWLFH